MAVIHIDKNEPSIEAFQNFYDILLEIYLKNELNKKKEQFRKDG